MTKRVTLQPAWVLHTRPFRDSRVLVDLLTRDYGRVSGVLRLSRRCKKSPRGVVAQPFSQWLVNWQGGSNLVSLFGIEPAGPPYCLMGKRLLSGLYLNEILVRLLHQGDPCPGIYAAYHQVLIRLSKATIPAQVAAALRHFELTLLRALGYGFSLDQDYRTGDMVLPNAYYYFVPWEGMTRCATTSDTQQQFSGRTLRAIMAGTFDDQQTRQSAKYLMRLVLQALLGHREVKSRLLCHR